MIYFITGNKNKFEEARAIVPELEKLEIDLPELQEIDAKKIIEEKLKEALKHKKGEFVVEDTSLYLEALNGLPGPLIKWFLQTIGNKGIYNLAKKLGNNKAEAKTIIGYTKSEKEIHFFEGSIKGEIVYPNAATSFGWDPIFKPQGLDKSFAEMSGEEKNKISMRKIAFSKLKEFLEKQINKK
jgi:non-canonical purine NTP pyrophosphatase (RdgB/HAM1 family)